MSVTTLIRGLRRLVLDDKATATQRLEACKMLYQLDPECDELRAKNAASWHVRKAKKTKALAELKNLLADPTKQADESGEQAKTVTWSVGTVRQDDTLVDLSQVPA